MKTLYGALLVALIAMPMYASAKDDLGCDSVNWGKEVLAKFPNAEKACHGVTMKNGAAYAHYVAEVIKVGKESMTVHLIDRNGKAISEVEFVPPADQSVKSGGQASKFRDLDKGTTLDLYIEHNRWGLYSSPDSSPMEILSRKDL